MTPPPQRYEFRLPNLPKPVYDKLQQFRLAHDLSQWQAVIAAIHCMCRLGQVSPDAVSEEAKRVREAYPVKQKAKPADAME